MTADVTPLGVRNNNPLNIRVGSPWQGLADSSAGGGGFCIFKGVEWGFRAAFVLLFAYQDRHGLRTVADVVKRWAPPDDGNDTTGYIRAVCGRMGVMPSQVLDLHQWADAGRLVRAMAVQEQGSFDRWFTDGELRAGARLAGVEGVPPEPADKAVAVASGVGLLATVVAQPMAGTVAGGDWLHGLLAGLTALLVGVMGWHSRRWRRG